ncbi:cytochrome c oxidase assembly protein [Telluribacter humicola]|uniref:cytochrome c oxidase assembly protein n=1 Tax=Telluribacter humicola TaxID=1720261 RepID=UPI001A97A338|nr:cytochrome c oxidase assembly protein [Telluribacter humicola]
MHEHHPHHAESTTLGAYLPLVLLLFVAAIYLSAVWRLIQRHRNWNLWRTMSFISGIILLAVAMSPAMMSYAHADFRGHMLMHLLIGMLAPLGLVLGAPITLALKSLPLKGGRTLTAILRSQPLYFLSHPITTLLLNIGGMYLLYLTPLYNATLTSPALHYLIHIHFLTAGFLFTWSIAGPDPAPCRPGLQLRVMVLFVSIAAHAYLSKAMYAYLYPRHSPHPAEEIQAGAKLMYYGGDLSELLLAVALFSIWYQKRRHPRYRMGLLLD